MVSLEDIPAETRWEIAARSASVVPLLYDMHFRKVLREKYDDIELPIWVKSANEMKNLANELGLPLSNAKEISESMGVIAAILYGREMKMELIEGNEDRAIGRMTECAVLNRAKEMGLDPEISAQTACRQVLKTEAEALNPEFTQRSTMSMCAGDSFCEMVIERKR